MRILLDSNVFLCLAFEEPGADQCGQLLDSVYSGEAEGVISAIQLSELYTPFERARDRPAKEKMKEELQKSRIKIRPVDEGIAELSARIRATELTPDGNWLALADSIILATALIEKADRFCTLDQDFSNVKAKLEITAPGMSLDDWSKRFARARKPKKDRKLA